MTKMFHKQISKNTSALHTATYMEFRMSLNSSATSMFRSRDDMLKRQNKKQMTEQSNKTNIYKKWGYIASPDVTEIVYRPQMYYFI